MQSERTDVEAPSFSQATCTSNSTYVLGDQNLDSASYQYTNYENDEKQSLGSYPYNHMAGHYCNVETPDSTYNENVRLNNGKQSDYSSDGTKFPIKQFKDKMSEIQHLYKLRVHGLNMELKIMKMYNAMLMKELLKARNNSSNRIK